MEATRICSFPNCEARLYQKGLCRGHYDQRAKGKELTPIMRRVGCAVDACAEPHKALGYCVTHYRRFKRTGHPEHLLRIADGRERFDTFVEKTEACWLWRGSLTYDGYGIFRENNRRTGAHRFSYEYHIGPIPDGLHLDHLCCVRNCVNPAHLEPVTPRENDRRARERATQQGYADYERERKMGA